MGNTAEIEAYFKHSLDELLLQAPRDATAKYGISCQDSSYVCWVEIEASVGSLSGRVSEPEVDTAINRLIQELTFRLPMWNRSACCCHKQLEAKFSCKEN